MFIFFYILHSPKFLVLLLVFHQNFHLPIFNIFVSSFRLSLHQFLHFSYDHRFFKWNPCKYLELLEHLLNVVWNVFEQLLILYSFSSDSLRTFSVFFPYKNSEFFGNEMMWREMKDFIEIILLSVSFSPVLDFTIWYAFWILLMVIKDIEVRTIRCM